MGVNGLMGVSVGLFVSALNMWRLLGYCFVSDLYLVWIKGDVLVLYCMWIRRTRILHRRLASMSIYNVRVIWLILPAAPGGDDA